MVLLIKLGKTHGILHPVFQSKRVNCIICPRGTGTTRKAAAINRVAGSTISHKVAKFILFTYIYLI